MRKGAIWEDDRNQGHNHIQETCSLQSCVDNAEFTNNLTNMEWINSKHNTLAKVHVVYTKSPPFLIACCPGVISEA